MSRPPLTLGVPPRFTILTQLPRSLAAEVMEETQIQGEDVIFSNSIRSCLEAGLYDIMWRVLVCLITQISKHGDEI